MKLTCLLAITIWFTILEHHTSLCSENKFNGEPHSTALIINSQIQTNSSSIEDYEDELDDLELQASEHEIEAIYTPNGAVPLEQDKPAKKNKRRRRRRRRRKRIRTSTASYEDGEEINHSDLSQRLARPDDILPPDPEIISVPKRRPGKKRRKTTTPIPLEEEYLLTTNTESHVGQTEDKKASQSKPERAPENIEEIIEQNTAQDSLKYGEKGPPVIFLPLPTPVGKVTSKDIFTDKALIEKSIGRDILKSNDNIQNNKSRERDEVELSMLNPKENKINERLIEPIIFVTAPQNLNSTDTSIASSTKATSYAISIVGSTTSDPVKSNTAKLTTSDLVRSTTEILPPSKSISFTASTSKPNVGTSKNVLLKKLIAFNTTRDHFKANNTQNDTAIAKAIVEKTNETKSKNEKRLPLRRLPPTNAIFRKRFQPQTTQQNGYIKYNADEGATVSKENELAELKLYTISPLDIQKVGLDKQNERNEILTTNKINSSNLDSADEESKRSNGYKVNKKEAIIAYTTTPRLVQSTVSFDIKKDPSGEKIRLTKLVSALPTKISIPIPTKLTPIQTFIDEIRPTKLTPVNLPRQELIISYTSSSRKPTATMQTTERTEPAIVHKEDEIYKPENISLEDESVNIISTNIQENENSKDTSSKEINNPPQAKEDILIFLKSKAELSKLSKILQSRNMTLDELIDHRERGSSQLHLAEIFQKPNPSQEKISETEFDSATISSHQEEIKESENKFPEDNAVSSFSTSVNVESSANETIKEDRREPKFLFDSMPQFSLQGAASETIYTTKKISNLHYTRSTRPLLPNAKITPFYGSSEELILSYTSSTGRPNLYAEDDAVLSIREHEQKRHPSALKSVITISGAIMCFAVLGFFVLLVSCKVRQKKSQKYLKHNMLREHMRDETLRSSTRSDIPVVKKEYYGGCDGHSDTSSARQYYLWKTIRKTFRYE